MSQKGIIDLNINALDQSIRYPIRQCFYEVMDNFRIGTGSKSENGRLFRFDSTTSGTANQEFTIAHGLGTAPGQLIPTLSLNEVGAQLPVLTVSRAADANFIYLKSPSTGVAFTVLVEV